ncbi:MAG TPA: sugar ABC transporter substrate-binding protein [Candidatus Paceibacterota bacterium]|nr:sugar ABC transporter substrate-binding protein [Candidatus Paceibacterota bacterium]
MTLNSKALTYILVGIIGVGVLLTFVLILRNVSLSGGNQVTLNFLGVYDPQSDFTKVIHDFESQNPGVTINYHEATYDQYEQNLVNSLAAGNAPDIFMIHNTWLPKHGDKLAPMPDDIPNVATGKDYTIQDFKSDFVDDAYSDLVYQDQVYAMPLYVDTLALFYNKDLFNSAGITQPPRTWSEVNTDVPLLTKFDSRNNISQAAISLGTSQNINRSTDILMDMMIQSGTQMTDDDHRAATFDQMVGGQPVGQLALQYYTNFANASNVDYTWNASQPYSIDAFSQGTVAMMLGYAHDTQVIRSKAPRLNFAIAPMPQSSLDSIQNFANYWAVAVSKNSPNQEMAWKFIQYLTSKEGATSYLNAAARPAARRDLIDLQRSDPDLGVFAIQALTAKSWFEADNNAIDTIFASMIDDVNYNRSSAADAISHAASQVTVLMQK